MTDDDDGLDVDVDTTGVLFTVTVVWAALHMDKAFAITSHLDGPLADLAVWLTRGVIALGWFSLAMVVALGVGGFAVCAMAVESYLNGGQTL